MRRISIAVLTALAVFVTATIASAEAKNTTLCYKAFGVREAVVKKHGKRAPGRNICRFGMKGGKDATTKQKARYLRALKRLNNPPSPLLNAAGAPAVAPASTLSPRAGAGGTLAAIRACESGGNYATNTGNGFYGAYQFDLSTWQSVGGSGNPAAASPAEQDMRAAKLYAQRGASPWPVCGR